MANHKRHLSTDVESHGELIKAGITIAQIARDKLTVPAVNVLHDILTSPDSKDADRIAAARLAIERGWGSVTNRVELEIVPSDMTRLTDDELHAIAQLEDDAIEHETH